MVSHCYKELCKKQLFFIWLLQNIVLYLFYQITTMELYKTIPERISLLSETRGELQLAIEGRFTNLRIWVSKNSIFMRLDKGNAYSVPLNAENINYLKKPHPTVQKLLKFGFESSISNLNEILEITKDMKYRQCIEW